MTTVVVVANGRTGALVAQLAAARREAVRVLDDRKVSTSTRALAGAAAVVLVPRPGDAERNAHETATALIHATRGVAPDAHLLLVSSFAVGHSADHPFNRATGSRAGRLSAERAVRASGLPWTIVRPTWLTDDPAGAHAVTLTQDPLADGMIARADLASAVVAAIEHPGARHTTFALFNQPGPPPVDWEAMFAGLKRDRLGQ
jgi:uncharacterized protein YbjT (DUF2867 family)